MRATLYDALGVAPYASDNDVRAALRRQIRKYYAKTRDGHGNVEEALRFINHASRILTDPERRATYDHEIAVSSGTLNQRISNVVNTLVGKTRTDSTITTIGAKEASARSKKPAAPAAADQSERKIYHPGLTARVASFNRSTSVAILLCALFGTLIAAAIALVTPPDAVAVAKQVLVWVTLGLLALSAVYAVVHAIAWRHRTQARPRVAPATDPAIVNWRRERSVFLGTSHPQEDAGWIFQLRMAELERAKSGRTSEPRPWSRLAARSFDYAIWGLVLAVLLSESQALGIVSPAVAFWLSHPLAAPIAISATWIPVEAVLVALMSTTPGKWLFGVYLQFSISDAYAVHTWGHRLLRALSRSFRVWWMGLAGGAPLLAPITIAIAYERVAEEQETRWDSAEDCLVTHVPVGNLNTVTGVFGLVAMLWVYGVAWHQTMAESFDWARAAVESRVSSLPALPAGMRGGGAMLTGAGSALGLADKTSGSASAGRSSLPPVASADGLPIDPEVATLVVERKRQLAVLSVEGPRMLEAGNWRQAIDLCGTWASLDLDNAQAWSCYGRALQAEGHHFQAVKALRKARQYNPTDGTLDAAINRSQRGIISDFLSRRGR